MKLPKLNLPIYSFRYKKSSSNQPLIFDQVRKKWLILTPEEWVRQNIITHLIKALNYPESVFKIETGLYVNSNMRRSDVLVYKNSKPYVLIECKAYNMVLTQDVFSQALNYNSAYNCPFIVLTNGKNHKTINVSGECVQVLNDFPNYN
ncbi:MAG: restriction endonuclease subunit R [Flavobacteriales bacterium]|nr:restriction endonuclease subunit R [Flavobacteriales bacterium]|tara:strand:- start:1070 stop:1513 length:444 start_codon:yes stop_codon:yes gene_type:complete